MGSSLGRGGLSNVSQWLSIRLAEAMAEIRATAGHQRHLQTRGMA